MIDKKEVLKILIDLGKTQKSLAKELNKSPNTISKWLNGESFPSTQDVVAMCKSLCIIENDEKARIFLN